MSAPAIVHNAREQWLARRREKVTASDAPAILGFDPRRKPSDVYLEKLGLREPEESQPMKWGRRFEAGVAEGYAEATGRPVFELPPFELWQHSDLPWLAATGDRETEIVYMPPGSDDVRTVRAPLELKWHLVTGDRWKDGPPLAVQVQVQIQIVCRVTLVGSVTAFVSPFKPPAWADVATNENFLAKALPVLEAFHRAVQLRELPSDADWYSQAAVRRLWPTDNGQAVALSREDLLLVEEWEVAKLRHAEAKGQRLELEKRLRIRLGDALSGYLPDGSSFVLHGEQIKPKACACGRQIKKGFTRRVPRRWWPRHLRRARRALERAREQGR